MLRQLMLVCAVGFLAIAVADYAFERHQHYKQLRMSKDEVKREYKEMEGSPEIKSKRRQFHQELQSSNLRADVRRSSVIVANPTHVAIGIRYRRGETPLPLVTLKHTDALALRVRRIAEEEGIPVLQRIPLARALLRDGNVDQYIPADLIQATAEVLRWLESQQTDTPDRYRAGRPPRHRRRKTLRPGAEKKGPEGPFHMLATGQSLSGIPCTTPAVFSSRLLVAVWMNDSSFFCSSAWSGTSLVITALASPPSW